MFIFMFMFCIYVLLEITLLNKNKAVQSNQASWAVIDLCNQLRNLILITYYDYKFIGNTL